METPNDRELASKVLPHTASKGRSSDEPRPEADHEHVVTRKDLARVLFVGLTTGAMWFAEQGGWSSSGLAMHRWPEE